MADLDEFFARKDRRKLKAKPKLTPEEWAKKLEDSKKAKKNADFALAAAAAGSVAKKVNNVEGSVEEEWRDFEQEQHKDYSGLKIAQLTISEDKQQSSNEFVGDDNKSSENNSNGESIKPSPWKKLIPAEEVTQIPVEIVRKKTSKLYITPALRQSQLQGINGGVGGVGGVGPGSTRNRTAPDITNTEFFPTINAARPEEQRKKKKNEPMFVEVRRGGRVQRVKDKVAATKPKAATNRFQLLYDEDDC